MSQNSPRLNLPFLQPSQAQKHVTHNEALRRLDIVAQLSVASTNASTPPAVPNEGEVHALGVAPTGDWTGQAGMLAAWLDNTWHFVAPGTGWRAWDETSGQLQIWDGEAWVEPPVATQNLDGAGIGTSYDNTNRLSVQSPATLLSHEGAGHQLKINKANAGETASLLFQSNWTGHAEMGLTGDTVFAIKVSPDGSTWTDALSLDSTTGTASGSAVQASADDVTPGRLMRADYGFGPGNLLGSVAENGGTPTGAVIERGSTENGDYVRFADGTQICTAFLTPSPCTVTKGALFTSTPIPWNFPAPFAAGSIPAISGNGGAANRFLGSNTPSETTVTVKVLSMLFDETPVAPSITAIGRWF
ncbi:hypothetical protein RUE5091_01897 [Ruegeria denitrificans]|uniref:DUF2793 domain-containing protein n=1 Tax=Ruegeria denitrificans TaxID=1715692 RepID=A0A0P1I8M4_9RHOB|nr:DUF2793 domain-containing protein [Ruegeria denitrificans]CUJ98201.1 hypothetical protein RUE5091_01897 [Ruegeria denitrificans]